MRLFTSLFAEMCNFFANVTSSACYWGLLDEEEMPEELL